MPLKQWAQNWINLIERLLFLSWQLTRWAVAELRIDNLFPFVTEIFMARLRRFNEEMGYQVPSRHPVGTGVDPAAGLPIAVTEAQASYERRLEQRNNCLHTGQLSTYTRAGTQWRKCRDCDRRWKLDPETRNWRIDDADAP